MKLLVGIAETPMKVSKLQAQLITGTRPGILWRISLLFLALVECLNHLFERRKKHLRRLPNSIIIKRSRIQAPCITAQYRRMLV